MKQTLLTILRDKKTDITKFRRTSGILAELLAGEVFTYLEKEKITVETPIATTTGYRVKNHAVLIPILRSGLALLPAFVDFFQDATIGCIGLKRDEKTAIPKLYYKNLPKISKNDDVIILDPMIATGGSGSDAIKILKKEGIKEEKMIFAAVISSTPGIKLLKKNFPKMKIFCVQTDPKLNKNFFIVPGLGDFGDRFFGTL
jgi:uracil phosphoribosyltransferase